jgi:hypothetical protein
MKNLVDYMRSRRGEVNELVRGAEPCFTVVMLVLAIRPHHNEHGVLHEALLAHVSSLIVIFAPSVMHGRQFILNGFIS